MKDLNVSVGRGIELLDRRGPEGWRQLLNPERLDISQPEDCVLGQLYGSYYAGCRALDLFLTDPADYGLVCTGAYGQRGCYCPALTRIWVEVLRSEALLAG
jgi:hypothetical protein